MKTAVILYHKNILKIYKPDWILKCLESIHNQTYENYDIFELNYGDESEDENISLLDICKNLYFQNKKTFFYKKQYPNHIFAMNFLLNTIFIEQNYDIVFNINLDDFYDPTRFQKQVDFFNKYPNYDLLSSNFRYVDENDIPYLDKNLAFKFSSFSQNEFDEEQKYINSQFIRGHNIIGHPCVCMTNNFWKKVGPYRNKVGVEDFLLWKKAYKNGIKMHIIPEYLLFYRIHGKQVTASFR
jgi:hypothetical protein